MEAAAAWRNTGVYVSHDATEVRYLPKRSSLFSKLPPFPSDTD